MPSQYVTVAEDLAYLRVAWTGDAWSGSPSDDELRRNSSVLRRFLMDQVLQDAWRAHRLDRDKRQPTLIARGIDITSPLYLPAQHIILAEAQVEVFYNAAPPPPNERHLFRMQEREFGLNQFRDSAAVVVDRGVLTRRDIIKYFADIAGGVHLEISARSRHNNADLLRRIEKVQGRITLYGRHDAIRFELRAIGRRLAESPDLRRLEDVIRAAA